MRKRWDWTWLWLFLLALGLRLAFLPRAHVLQTEGTTYVTLARHLLQGTGYVGILGETELVMVSVFPHLIALVGTLVGNLVLGGRIIALFSGAALVIPTYFLGRDLFHRRAGIASALLVAFHPYLLMYAPLVRVENPFMFVWLFGIYATWRALIDGPRGRWWLGVPIFFGGAYQLKSEGAVYFTLSLMLIFLIWYRRYRPGTWAPALLLQSSIFLLIALPVVVWLSGQTGRLTTDTKGLINYTIAIRIAHGMDYHHAAYGLAAGGAPAGPLLDRNRMVRLGVGQKRPALEDPAYRQGMVRTLIRESQLLRWPLLGYLWIGVAGVGVILGLTRRDAWKILFPAWYVIPAFLGVSTILFVWTRYLLPVIPLTALWAGYGVDELAKTIAKAWRTSPRTTGRVYIIGGGLILLFLIGLHPYTRIAWRQRTVVHDLEQEQAGLWLREHDSRPDKRIMSTTSQVPYYAAGVHVPMPVDDRHLILQYMARRHVEYVVISEAKDKGRPTAYWLDPNHAPPGWELLFRNENPRQPAILIYHVKPQNCGCGQ